MQTMFNGWGLRVSAGNANSEEYGEYPLYGSGLLTRGGVPILFQFEKEAKSAARTFTKKDYVVIPYPVEIIGDDDFPPGE